MNENCAKLFKNSKGKNIKKEGKVLERIDLDNARITVKQGVVVAIYRNNG